ncbi:MAG: 2-oxo acid dehydrogenase subunit E2 [Acidimicrobiia bacterium]|nr:2-oxo acid dehydrogenase subunit E2 [Acidimicrobiia bacterium]
MFWWRRADGDLVKDGTDLRRIMPYVMRSRTGATVYFDQRIDVRNAERFVRAFNEAHPETRTTLFHVVMWAARQGLTEFPALNRFVAGGRLYQRAGLWISYSAKQRMKRGAPLLVLKRRFEPDESFASMVTAMGTQLQSAKFGGAKSTVDSELGIILKLPGVLRRVVFAAYRALEALGALPNAFIENDPLYASIFLTDLGSIGMDPAYHHLYEYGTIGIFGAVGRARNELVGDVNTGRLEKQRIAGIRWSFDERVEDGLYAGYALKHVKKLIEDPIAGGIADDDPATRAALGVPDVDLTAGVADPLPTPLDER